MYSNLDYLAGLFDGEGSFSIQIQPRKAMKWGRGSVVVSPRVSMTLKYNKFILNDYVEQFGGRIYHYEDGMDRWSISDAKRARIFAETMLPYLHMKRSIGSTYISALDVIQAGRNKTNDVLLAKLAYSLNPVRKQTRPIQELLDQIDEIYASKP